MTDPSGPLVAYKCRRCKALTLTAAGRPRPLRCEAPTGPVMRGRPVECGHTALLSQPLRNDPYNAGRAP